MIIKKCHKLIIALALIDVVIMAVEEGGMLPWNGGQLTRHYGVWSYFQSLPGEENHRFVNAHRTRFGIGRVISAPVEAAYVGVKLWAQAVQNVLRPYPWPGYRTRDEWQVLLERGRP